MKVEIEYPEVVDEWIFRGDLVGWGVGKDGGLYYKENNCLRALKMTSNCSLCANKVRRLRPNEHIEIDHDGNATLKVGEPVEPETIPMCDLKNGQRGVITEGDSTGKVVHCMEKHSATRLCFCEELDYWFGDSCRVLVRPLPSKTKITITTE